MIAIVDYGVGNLFSLQCSLAEIGAEAEVSHDPETLRKADKVILPGVGAFADAAKRLEESGLDALLKELAGTGKPILGICLGMQLLFERSFEYGEQAGLGLIEGSVRSIAPVIGPGLKTPHIGWNALHFGENKHPLFRYCREGDCVYFVHSYAAMDCEAAVTASTEYGAMLTAAVAKGNVMGTQFHPEKSGETGLSILRAFCGL